MENLVFIPEALNGAWDAVEVWPVREEDGACETCEEGEEHFWSVYVHRVEGGVSCVADLPDKAAAYALAELIERAGSRFRFQTQTTVLLPAQ